jgi:PAS domain S-box-containing protein
MFQVFSIRRKLIVAFILIGVFPMLIATYIGVKIASGRLEKGIEERVNYAGKSAVYLLGRKKAELEGVAKSFSGDPRLRQAIQGGINIKFLWFDTPLKVFLFNDKDTMIFSSIDADFSKPENPREGMTLLQATTGKVPWPLLVYLLPVEGEEKPIGTIMTGYTLDQEFLNDLKSMTGVDSMLFKQDGSGSYVSISTDERLSLSTELFGQTFLKSVSLVKPDEEKDYRALLTPLPDAEGRVSLILFNGIPTSETLSGKLASAKFYYILILIGLLLSVVAGSAVATGISWPILRFSQGVRAISAGDYSQKIHVKSRDEIGELAESFNQMTDRLKNTIAQLVENQNYTDNILRSLPNGVITIGSDNRIARVNRAAKNILRRSSDKLVGKPFEQVFKRDEAILSLIRNCMNLNQIKEGVETGLHNKDGSITPLELSLSVLEDPTDPAGEGLGLVILLRDLTEIQYLKEHIRRQDRLAALGELSAGIAHEIRNPLGIIKGAAGIINKGNKQAKLDELSSIILEEVDRLNDVISDFLEFARPRPPVFKAQNINDLIKGTLQITAMQIEKQHVILRTHLDSGIPAIMADEHQMHQVFLNLILNALQATESGDTIDITTRYLSETGQIEVLFRDKGAGIPPDKIKKVFNPFFTTKEKGTGLGLAVVNKIVENHHGKIFLSSEEGKGTCFTIQFPAAEKFETVLSET